MLLDFFVAFLFTSHVGSSCGLASCCFRYNLTGYRCHFYKQSLNQFELQRFGSAQPVLAFEALRGELCKKAHFLLMSNHYERVLFRSYMSLRLLLRTNGLNITLSQASHVTPEV